MIALLTALAGAILGTVQARRRQGTTADILQFAFVYALIGGLLGVFVSIFLLRLS